MLNIRRWLLSGDIDYHVKSYHGHDAIARLEIAWHGKRIDALAHWRKSWLRDKLIVWHAERRLKAEKFLVDLSISFHREAIKMQKEMYELESKEVEGLRRKAMP